MKIKVNDKEVQTSAETLAQLAAEMNLPAKGVAVAINQNMIHRSDWETTPLSDGQDIIIINAVCGG